MISAVVGLATCEASSQEALSVADVRDSGAVGWSPTQGGETLSMGTRAFEVRIGIPALSLKFDIPATPFLQVNPYASFQYSWFMILKPFFPPEFYPSGHFGVEMKFKLFSLNHHAMSLSFDTGCSTMATGTFFSPDLRYSYRWDNPRIAVFTGFRAPYMFTGEGPMFLPMLFMAGFEYNVHKRLNIHVIIEPGLLWSIGDDDDESDIGPVLGFEAGLSCMF